jgi:hypothetical protein
VSVCTISLGNALGLAGLAVAFLIYSLQMALGRRRDSLTARSALLSVRQELLHGWGATFFTTVYDDTLATAQAQAAYDAVVQDKTYAQIFAVPRESLVALVNHPAAGDLIFDDTVRSASDALYGVGLFNQLVEQQTSYNALHAADIRGDVIDDKQRIAIANGAFSISMMIHRRAIDGANTSGGWYARLRDEVQRNLASLDERVRRRWWVTPSSSPQEWPPYSASHWLDGRSPIARSRVRRGTITTTLIGDSHVTPHLHLEPHGASWLRSRG